MAEEKITRCGPELAYAMENKLKMYLVFSIESWISRKDSYTSVHFKTNCACIYNNNPQIGNQLNRWQIGTGNKSPDIHRLMFANTPTNIATITHRR